MAPLKTIAVGYDGSRDSQVAVRWAAQLAMATGAQLVVVHAVGLLEGTERPQLRPDPSIALETASSVGLEPQRLQWLALDGDPCTVLLRVADPPISADVVVVGTRGAGQHSGTILGSTSLELAESTTIPLTIVPNDT
jgi:nucleotide-binding universal stress UspA family protein